MEHTIKQYKIERVEIARKTIDIPTETTHYVTPNQSHVRVTPHELDKSWGHLLVVIVSIRPLDTSTKVVKIFLSDIEKVYHEKTDSIKKAVVRGLFDGDYIKVGNNLQFEAALDSFNQIISNEHN